MENATGLIRQDLTGVERDRLLKRADFTGRRLLEIGCGDGRLTWQIAREASYFWGVEPDLAAIQTAQRNRPRSLERRVAFSAAVAERLPFADRRFDFVLFSWSF